MEKVQRRRIEEDYVSLSNAKLLKENGFEEPCMYHYTADGEKIIFQQAHYPEDIARPTHQRAIKWLRETKRIHIEIRITNESISNKVDVVRYYFVCFDTKNAKWIGESTLTTKMIFKDYEEAVEAAIEYSLKHLIKELQ